MRGLGPETVIAVEGKIERRPDPNPELATGAVERGMHYLDQYPGTGGWMLAAACTVAVFMAGGRIIDAIEAASHATVGASRGGDA